MPASDRAVVARWRAKLTIRTRLLAAARRRYKAKPNSPSAVRTVREREKQVAEAERVIDRHSKGHVSLPVDPILQSSWGYHPGVHDGVDLITDGDDTIVAICDGTVLRASSSGWWGKGARASGGHSISEGDGVIVLRCSINEGPFQSGTNFVYGHAEHPTVKPGQRVKAGQRLGRAGFANAWHIHFCVNRRFDDRGVGDHDPMPYVEYARRNS
jgi:murein DD-endopeptidase MepM/ murein hydrolase activator NlpD